MTSQSISGRSVIVPMSEHVAEKDMEQIRKYTESCMGQIPRRIGMISSLYESFLEHKKCPIMRSVCTVTIENDPDGSLLSEYYESVDLSGGDKMIPYPTIQNVTPGSRGNIHFEFLDLRDDNMEGEDNEETRVLREI